MMIEGQSTNMELRLRIAGALIFAGLLIEGFTLTWNNPIAFLVFLGAGGVLMLIGIVFYLISLVSPSPSP